jgi:hypothetical protein
LATRKERGKERERDTHTHLLFISMGEIPLILEIRLESLR